MPEFRKLPDAEFEIMKAVWKCQTASVGSAAIMRGLTNGKKWKAQTVLTLLSRLVDRGFLSTDKIGKERIYSPLVNEEDYISFETGNFINRFHNNSFASLLNTFYGGKKLESKDIEELRAFVDSKH